MKAKLEKQVAFLFSAAHLIPTPAAGNESRMHGHTYQCQITLEGFNINQEGYLIAPGVIENLVTERYDNVVLNNLPEYTIKQGMRPDMHPSTEMLAVNIFGLVQQHLDSLPVALQCTKVELEAWGEGEKEKVIYHPVIPEDWGEDDESRFRQL